MVSAGGAIGAVARYGLGVLWPTPPGDFPWATFVINVSGCLLIGMLTVLMPAGWRPFVSLGILGGYTTFSAYAVDFQQLIAAGRAGLAIAYLGATVITALAAVYIGDGLGRAVRNR